MTTLASPTGRSQTLTALFLAVAMAVVVGTALGFQHIGGYMPCKLCLEQRTPYYVGVPLMALAALSSAMHWPAWMTRALLALGGLLMLYGLYLGAFHAGVEWRWWAGPTDCAAVSGTIDTGGKGLLDVLNEVVPPRCEDAALRVLGLSFAGWNVLASAFLAVVALRGAFRKG
ncbi:MULTISPECIES: disulfide bond formation protein B [Aminobacter]|uniref:Disulfide bond formation protein DsbB n=1 Tax=Aminobacter niigataensis TaxID=83265 RepID=A0ABR6L0F1_9HYPH|nr:MULTISPECIES: disulfide bond formation protein B [Aminobacter]AWC22302.1 disulfide bond formation protein B [Aminobacter sp. MSH1]MBB4650283.1 disulfide bond formation protein DsbB [Aminobacter niigataensis]CAI2933033.1 Periplasmic thiol:disulfide oxidoreductase DsbB, required for DsbA reoxidation [Aminobacter niigataensis]